MIDPMIWTAAFVVLLVVFVREWWRQTVIRKSLSLSDELVRLLSGREILWLRQGLTRFLEREGAPLADDPRVTTRLALFESVLQGRQDRLVRRRHSRALHAAGLPPMNETA